MAELAWKYDFPEEADLLERARGRDPYAIRFIIQRHNQRLYRIARSIVRHDFEAEDVLQEAYFRAFSNLGSFRGEARIGTWLSRIVVNEALGSLRRRDGRGRGSAGPRGTAAPRPRGRRRLRH